MRVFGVMNEVGTGEAAGAGTPIDLAAQVKAALASLQERIAFHRTEAKRLTEELKSIKGSLVTRRAKKGTAAPRLNKEKKADKK